jgi:hypothetical protein
MCQSHAEPDEAAPERRRLDRQPFVRSAQVFCPTARPRPTTLPEGVSYCPVDLRSATVHDRSRQGFGFTTHQPLPVGIYQKLRLAGDESPNEAVPEVKVVRCDANADGTYTVGARRT